MQIERHDPLDSPWISLRGLLAAALRFHGLGQLVIVRTISFDQVDTTIRLSERRHQPAGFPEFGSTLQIERFDRTFDDRHVQWPAVNPRRSADAVPVFPGRRDQHAVGKQEMGGHVLGKEGPHYFSGCAIQFKKLPFLVDRVNLVLHGHERRTGRVEQTAVKDRPQLSPPELGPVPGIPGDEIHVLGLCGGGHLLGAALQVFPGAVGDIVNPTVHHRDGPGVGPGVRIFLIRPQIERKIVIPTQSQREPDQPVRRDSRVAPRIAVDVRPLIHPIRPLLPGDLPILALQHTKLSPGGHAFQGSLKVDAFRALDQQTVQQILPVGKRLHRDGFHDQFTAHAGLVRRLANPLDGLLIRDEAMNHHIARGGEVKHPSLRRSCAHHPKNAVFRQLRNRGRIGGLQGARCEQKHAADEDDCQTSGFHGEDVRSDSCECQKLRARDSSLFWVWKRGGQTRGGTTP